MILEGILDYLTSYVAICIYIIVLLATAIILSFTLLFLSVSKKRSGGGVRTNA